MQISNNTLSIVVNDHGAELASIKYNGREYLWGAYPEFWKRHSPVLFPIVGSVWNGEYRSGDKVYKMGQHGLARDLDFTLVKQSEDYLEYELRSNAETLAKYPYPFILNIGYRLHGKSIDVIWRVTNPADEEMYFSIGAHPAFYWPLLSNDTITSGVESMNSELAKSTNRGYFYFKELSPSSKPSSLIRTLITEGGCVDINQKEVIKLSSPKLRACSPEHQPERKSGSESEEGAGSYLPLTTETFAKDALVLENNQVHEVTLCDQQKKPYLTLSWDAPLVGLWSPPGKNAPFVCIEPWYGRADRAHYEGTFEEKDWMQHLPAKGVFEVKYTITIE